MGYYRWNG